MRIERRLLRGLDPGRLAIAGGGMDLGGLLGGMGGRRRGILRGIGAETARGSSFCLMLDYIIHLIDSFQFIFLCVPLTVRYRCGSGRVGGFVAFKNSSAGER